MFGSCLRVMVVAWVLWRFWCCQGSYQRASEVKELVKSKSSRAKQRHVCGKFCGFPQVVSESKMVREILCFTIETAVGGCECRRCETAVAAMVAYARPCQTHCNGGFEFGAVLLGNGIAGDDGGAVSLGNVIEGSHCGAVLLGNAIQGFRFHGCRGVMKEWQLKVSMAQRCFWGMSLHVLKRFVTVGCRSLWVAGGAAVLLEKCKGRFPWRRCVLGDASEGC